jgi:ubiquinone/menaquinone biosynthesis C-methylase UbiE
VDDVTFKHADAASYDAYAEQYDRFVSLLAPKLADEIVRLAALRPGDRVLDVGCGSALATERAAQAVRPHGAVTGVDLSEGMLAVGIRRIAGLEHVELRQMDAERLEFGEASFDAVISLCAVLHFPEIDRALREMRRVLVSGGRLVVSFGSGRPRTARGLAYYLPRRLAGRLARLRRPEVRAPHHLETLVRHDTLAPPHPLLATWGETRPLPRLLEAVRQAGFEGVSTSWRGREVEFGSAEDFWGAQLAIATEVRKRLAASDDDTIERIRERFLADAKVVLARGGKLVYPYGATFVTATAPRSGR